METSEYGTNRVFPFTLSRDWEDPFVDQNAARNPSSPLAPLVVAVKYYNPSLNFEKLDMLTDRNNLRKLFPWASSTNKKDFRIDLELVG
jgi:hypothetical protein